MAPLRRRGESPAVADDASAGSAAVASPRELLLAHAGLLRALFAFVAEQHDLSLEEARAFEAMARRRLADDDHAIVREFRGRSTFATYLTVVVHRIHAGYEAAGEGKAGGDGRLYSQETTPTDE